MIFIGVNELRSDAHTVAALAHTALHDVAGAEFLCDLLEVVRLPPEGEAGVTRDHRKGTPEREVRDDVFGDAVREVLLLRIAAHVREWQHRNCGNLGLSVAAGADAAGGVGSAGAGTVKASSTFEELPISTMKV